MNTNSVIDTGKDVNRSTIVGLNAENEAEAAIVEEQDPAPPNEEQDPAPPNEARDPLSNELQQNYSVLAVALVFAVPALGGFLFGYEIAATTFVLKAITTTATTKWTSVIASSAVWQGIVVSLSSLGAWISSWYVFARNSGDSKNTIGRRTELQLGAMLYILGAALEVSAVSISNNVLLGMMTFFIGRLLYGFGIGIAMHAAPTYLGEMCPSSIRGFLVSLKEACIVLGMVFGYGIGSLVSGSHWGTIYSFTLVFSGTMWVMSTFMIPESGRYLLLQDPVEHEQQAILSFEFVFPNANDALRQVREIQASLEQEYQESTPNRDGGDTTSITSKRNSIQLLLEPQYRLPLTAGLGLVMLQQVTGQPSILSYATQVLHEAGLSGSSTIPIALFKLLATLVAAGTVETYGRVQLLLTGCSMMLLALIVLTISFSAYFVMPKMIVLLSLFVYIGGYQVGFGPITWLITSEVFPLAIRGQAVALAIQFNFLFNALVQFLVPVLQQAVGLSWTFLVFALLGLFSLYFIHSFVPETKGLTLEEIEGQFDRMQRGVDTGHDSRRLSMGTNEHTLAEPLLRSDGVI